ncbi:hypothetical protein Esti_004277 [Eimeria stiedai]
MINNIPSELVKKAGDVALDDKRLIVLMSRGGGFVPGALAAPLSRVRLHRTFTVLKCGHDTAACHDVSFALCERPQCSVSMQHMVLSANIYLPAESSRVRMRCIRLVAGRIVGKLSGCGDEETTLQELPLNYCFAAGNLPRSVDWLRCILKLFICRQRAPVFECDAFGLLLEESWAN